MNGLKNVMELQKRQQTRYNALKKEILKKLTDKISNLSKHGELRCIYTVQNYTFGFRQCRFHLTTAMQNQAKLRCLPMLLGFSFPSLAIETVAQSLSPAPSQVMTKTSSLVLDT